MFLASYENYPSGHALKGLHQMGECLSLSHAQTFSPSLAQTIDPDIYLVLFVVAVLPMKYILFLMSNLNYFDVFLNQWFVNGPT